MCACVYLEYLLCDGVFEQPGTHLERDVSYVHNIPQSTIFDELKKDFLKSTISFSNNGHSENDSILQNIESVSMKPLCSE